MNITRSQAVGTPHASLFVKIELDDRIARLRRRHDAFLHEMETSRVMLSAGEVAEAGAIVADVYGRGADQPEVLRRVTFLEEFSRRIAVRIEDGELIVGSQRFNLFARHRDNAALPESHRFRGNMGHIIVDYGRVLRRGVCGLRKDIAAMSQSEEQQRHNREAFRRALDAFSLFITRHAEAARALADAEEAPDRNVEFLHIAENCERIAANHPETFWQALQLTWFIQVFLHAESSGSAISFGRFDQFLWPFLEHDLSEGAITMDEAEKLVACFWLKCCEGDESQNVVLGGVDAEGRNAENPLFILCLNVTRTLKVWQPPVSVRIAPDTSGALWQAALDLCADGFGMPAFFNDPVVIESLEAVGIPTDRARDWGIVGCYEASPQGDCCAQTVAGKWLLSNALLGFLEETDNSAHFDDFLNRLKSFLAADYANCLGSYQTHWHWMRERQTSPFQGLCTTGCIESGRTAEEGGARFSLFGVNILGLATLVDSLYTIKTLVYGEERITLDDLRRQLQQDFPDERIRALCRNLPGKYGTDSDDTNELACEIAGLVADLVLSRPMEHGVRPYPGLFYFTGWAQADVPATPDGRRNADTVSYGIGPSSFAVGKTPTSVLKSASLAANDRCACGNPLMLSLNRSDIQGESGVRRIRSIIETYFRQGGFHLQFNIIDADQLREAKASPETHANLLVRISGLSAQFVTLDERRQNGIIERTEQGL